MEYRLVLVTAFVLSLLGCGPDHEGADDAFSLVRLRADGQRAAGAVETWDCVRDERTGLVWEVKSDRRGLRYAGNTYTWYAPDSKAEPLDYRGTPNGGSCEESDCDTHSFVEAVNELQLCGFSDWRMPYRQELRSISDPRRPITAPTLDIDFFPNAVAGEYWSGNGYRMQHDAAWAWGFDMSLDRVDWKREAKHVRLVRGMHKDLVRLTRGSGQ